MMRTNLNRALAFAAVMLLATSATAQSPNAAPAAKANADKKEEKKADNKAEDNKAKADDNKAKAADNKGGADKPDMKAGGDREARKNAEHAAQKAKLATMLKSPPDDALRQELRRHAERTARLERIKALATEAKDNDTVEKAKKLLEKENARHDKWMSKVATPAMGETNAKPGTPAAAPAATDNKAGAK